jgi:hypothetical protein
VVGNILRIYQRGYYLSRYGNCRYFRSGSGACIINANRCRHVYIRIGHSCGPSIWRLFRSWREAFAMGSSKSSYPYGAEAVRTRLRSKLIREHPRFCGPRLRTALYIWNCFDCRGENVPLGYCSYIHNDANLWPVRLRDARRIEEYLRQPKRSTVYCAIWRRLCWLCE